MKSRKELEIKTGGRILGFTEIEDGVYRFLIETDEQEVASTTTLSHEGDVFVLVEAESLSMDDEFMQWEPKSDEIIEAKELITEAICSGVKNFYRPKYDPSFTDDRKGICFVPRKRPAVGKSYYWWFDTAKEYWPERNSRLMTRLEYGAFLGCLIKKLVENGMSIFSAWSDVSYNSNEVGHYCNSKNSKNYFEPTGSRCVCGFYDLANTYKFLSDSDTDSAYYWLASGNYECKSYYDNTLAHVGTVPKPFRGFDKNSVGLIVLS